MVTESQKNVPCPVGHEGCIATISYSDLINEERIAYKLGRHLAEANNVFISHLCTDSDAMGRNGIEVAMQEAQVPLFTVTKMKGPNHLGQSQHRAIQKHRFSSNMFVCVKSPHLKKEIKAKCLQAFANDIPEL
jgi:hypothetical protein